MTLQKIAAIAIGGLLISVGLNFFLIPLRVLDGGVIGIALIVNYLFKIHVGLTMILVSVPIFAIAWIYDKEYFFKSIVGLLFTGYVIDLLYPYHYHFLYYVEWTPFVRSVIGGFIVGTGIGIMLRFDISTGGTDLMAKLISKSIPLNVGVIILVTDGIVVGLGKLLLPEDTFLLSLLTITAGGIATSLCTFNWKGN